MYKRIFAFVFLFAFFQMTTAKAQNSLTLEVWDCVPNSGWRWVYGSESTELEAIITQSLQEKGIFAKAKVRGFGEVDSCGSYLNNGYDYKIDILEQNSQIPSKSIAASTVKSAVLAVNTSNLGNIAINFPDGTFENTSGYELINSSNLEDTNEALNNNPVTGSGPLIPGSFYRNVYVIIANPILSNGTDLITNQQWHDPYEISNDLISFFNTVSDGHLQYKIVDSTVYSNGWLELVDGYVYNEEDYLEFLETGIEHQPSGVNYNKILGMPEFDICGRVNRGEIDEVWLWGGPGFGFWESTLAGPEAYWYNSPPVPEPWDCSRLVPVMGLNYERQLPEAVESFGHRSESALHQTYRNHDASNNWRKFSLVSVNEDPPTPYSGCGNIHFPPNGVVDYDWSNYNYAQTYCEDFSDYPNLPSVPRLSSVNCSLWNCNGLDYFRYWFRHIPHFPDCGPDNISNLWWNYLSTPTLANDAFAGCEYHPKLFLNQTTGRAGSAFTLRGTGFTPNSVANIKVNSFLQLETIEINSFGNFVVILQTDDSFKSTRYYVEVISGNGAYIEFWIDPNVDLLLMEGLAPVIPLHVENYILCPATIHGWKGEYWDNWTWMGDPVVCRDDPELNFYWCSEAPHPLLPPDFFSVRWTKSAFFHEGTYQFAFYHDDGASILIDDTAIYEDLCSLENCMKYGTVERDMQSGWHTVTMKMRENDGYSGVNLLWDFLPDIYEPDNSMSNAQPISLNQSQIHNITPVGDEDWVTFSLTQRSSILLQVTGISNSNIGMYLYDSSSKLLEYNNNSMIGRDCGFDELVPGVYYVKNQAMNSAEIGSYTISLQTSTCPNTFAKVSPKHQTYGIAARTNLNWLVFSGDSRYEYCIDTINNNTCDTRWIRNGSSTTASIQSLRDNTSYFWQVRAIHSAGSIYANSGRWWRFTTISMPSQLSTDNLQRTKPIPISY